MGRVAFSPDGLELYYTLNDSWNSLEHGKIMRVKYANGAWGKPTVVNEQFISPTMSLDGSVLYFRRGNMRNVWQSSRAGLRPRLRSIRPGARKPFPLVALLPWRAN